MDLKIFEMAKCHVKEVSALDKDIFDTAWGEQSFLKGTENENAYFCVASIGEEIVGYGGFEWVLDEGQIMNIAVKDNFRKQGIGKKLLEHLIDKAKEHKLCELTLEVKKSNITAQNLYQNAGFYLLGERKNYYPNGEAALILKLDLTI